MNMCLFFMIVYILLLVIVMGQIVRADENAVKGIHYLFVATAAAGVLTYWLYYLYMNKLNEMSEVGHTMSILVRMVEHIFSTLFLASLLLVSYGWTISRTHLTEREKNFALLSLGFYLSMGLASSLGSGTLGDFFNVMTYVTKTIVLLGIVLALNFTVTQLRAIIVQSPWIQSILLHYARSKQYSKFRSAFLAYLILPTVILLLQFSFLSWKTLWIADFMSQMVDLMLAVLVGATFYPLSESYLSRAFDGTMDSSVLRQRQERIPHERMD